MLTPESITGEIECPRCGDPAKWETVDSSETEFEVDCSECGRFPITIEQLEEAVAAYDDQNE